MIAKAVVLLGWLAVSWWALMFADPGPVGVVLLTISVGLAMAGIGFGVMHDANHGSFSARAGVNRVVGHTMELLGGSSLLWRQKHNVLHHGFTNVAGADADIEPGPLLRFAPWQPWRPYHRFQRVYVWALYAIYPLGWWLVDPTTGSTVDMLDDGRGATMVEWATIVVLVQIVAVVAIYCLGSASRAAAWNAWVAQMQSDAAQLGAAVGDLPTRDGACS